MRKGNDIIGKPVVAFDTGDRLTRIKDLIFDDNSNYLLGFLLDDNGWFSKAQVLPLSNIQAIGPDAVIAKSRAAVVLANQVPEIYGVIERGNVLTGTQMMTTDGRDLGVIADIYFDEITGSVEGYEVSGGLFADAYSGRSFVPVPHTLKVGKNVAFVPPETATLMEPRQGGIKAAVQSASERLQSARTTNDPVTATPTAYTVEQTEGLRVHRPVKTADGVFIAAPGQIVTTPVIERARVSHKEQELIAAVGLTSSEPLDTTHSAPDRFRDGVAQAQVEAQGLWERVKHKVTDIKERTAQASEARRIKEALGRPVQRVILDRQDNVILNVGELVTHRAVEEARQADMLDILLDSVDEQEPEIFTEEQRAPVSGDASLEERQQIPDV